MNDKISWLSVRSLVRLEMRARFGSKVDTTPKDKAAKALGIIFTLAIYAILVTGIYFLAEMFVRRSHMPFEFLVVAMTFAVCVTTLVSIGNVVKNLYLSGDNELLLRFPVSGKEILLAKSIYCFIHNVVINLLVMLPVCIIYGVVASAPVGYYFVALAVILVAIPLPYAIANLLAIPVMMVMNLVKNQFLLVLILLIAAICGVFILYMTALSGVLEYMRDEGENMFSPAVMDIFRNFANSAYPFRWYAMMLGGWFAGYSPEEDPQHQAQRFRHSASPRVLPHPALFQLLLPISRDGGRGARDGLLLQRPRGDDGAEYSRRGDRARAHHARHHHIQRHHRVVCFHLDLA